VDPARARAMRAAFDSSVVDTTPSREALEVLGTIAEPLRSDERVPPPAVTLPPDTAAADSIGDVAEPAAPGTASERGPASGSGAAPDTAAGPGAPDVSGAETGAPHDTSAVPVPEPREPLGDLSPAPDVAPVDPPADPAGATSPPPAAPAASDSCWGVQVAAPPESAKAEAMRAAAQSLLLVEMKIELSGGRRRVRTRDCLTREAADQLRRRAVESGFAGAFRVGPPPAVPAPAEPAPPKKKTKSPGAKRR
jgi:hypothetical protein